MNRRRSWVFGLLVGVAIGGATFVWLVSDPFLATTLALVYTVATGLSLRHRTAIPWGIEKPAGYDPWNAAWVAIAFGAALSGVSFTLPLSLELRLALQLLVLGVALATFQCGVGMMHSLPEDERHETYSAHPD